MQFHVATDMVSQHMLDNQHNPVKGETSHSCILLQFVADEWFLFALSHRRQTIPVDFAEEVERIDIRHSADVVKYCLDALEE